jgi:hypothetical protein
MPYNTPGVQEEDIWRIPLVGAPNSRAWDSSRNLDQRFKNCLFEQVSNPITGTKKYYVIKRPGFQEHTTPAAGNTGAALKVLNTYSSNNVISAWGNVNSGVYIDTTPLGNISGEATFIEEVLIGATTYIVISSGDSTLWYYAMGGTTGNQTFTADTTNTLPTLTNVSSTTNLLVGQALSGTGIPAGARILTIDSATQITMTANATATNAGITITRTSIAKVIDSDYPGNNSRTTIGRIAALDGYLFVMDTTGRIYNSTIDSITSWDGSYISAQGSPDKGIGVIRYKNYILAFGAESIEFFRNAGNETGSPLERMQEGFTRIGCLGQFSYGPVEDTIAWVSSGDPGGIGIYLLEGFTPKRISTSSVERQIIAAISTYATQPVYVSSCKLFGKTLVFISPSITNLVLRNTFVFSIEDQMWSEWQSDLAADNTTTIRWFLISGISSNSNSKTVYTMSRGVDITGAVYKIPHDSAPVYQDAGENFTMSIQTAKVDGDNDFFKRLTKFKLIGDSTSSSSTVNVSWSDDDYATFSTARSLDLSTTNNTLPACGAFKRRAFKITNAQNTAVRLEAMELHVKQGQH